MNKNLRILLSYLKPHKWQLLVVVIALSITSSIALIAGKGLSYFIDAGLSKGNVEVLNNSFLVLAVMAVIIGIATYIRASTIYKICEKVIAKIREDVFANLIYVMPKYFEDNKTSEIISRIVADTTTLNNVIANVASVAFRNIIMLVGGVFMLVMTNLRLFGLMAVLIPFALTPIIFISSKLRLASKVSQDRLSDIASHIDQSFSFLKIVQAYVAELWSIALFRKYVANARGASILRIKLRSVMIALTISFGFLSVASVLWLGSKMILDGNMTAGELSAFIFYSVVVATSLSMLSEVAGDIQRAVGSTERLLDLMSLDFHIRDKETAIEVNDIETIEFNDVEFGYNAGQMVLKGLSLKINKGETVAIIGKSGSGKSTLFQLLLRMYQPSKGTINVNGININNIKLASLRSKFAYVAQDSMIFSLTAEENIRFSNQGASVEELNKAMDLACASEFISKLPEGKNSYLGEKGVKLSGGQKQRVSLARALLSRAKVLLLDEATSALDNATEQVVQANLEQHINQHTKLIIAHRLSTIKNAEKVYLIEDGVATEISSEEALNY